MRSVTLLRLPGAYAVARLDSRAGTPAWADGSGFVSVSRTEDELSVVCLEERVPADVRRDGGWTCFKFQGPFAFDETGIALAVIQPLSQAAIGVFLVSTFDTDYLLVKTRDVERSLRLLIDAGHRLA